MIGFCTFLMNMDTNVNRLHNFEQHYGYNFTRIAAVEASEFMSKDYPCLPKHSHYAYKSLTSTMVRTMETALLNESCSYAVIFEDDASPPRNFHERIPKIISHYEPIDVLYMDARNARLKDSIPGCCLMGTIYSRKAMRYLSTSMNWKASTFMQFYSIIRHKVVDNEECLNDWMQANLLGMTKLKVASYPIIHGHGKFVSTVSGH